MTSAHDGSRAVPADAAAPPSAIGPGLTAAQAAEVLLRDGPNVLQRHGPQGLWPLAREVLTEPLFLLLTAAGLVYLALGARADALMLLGFVGLSLAVTMAQAHRTQGVLAALQDLATPQAWVLRDGRRQRIPGEQVVRGDVMLLRDGDRVAADGDLLSASDLLIDESILTGESQPVAKGEPSATTDAHVLAGCMVVAGTGWARVTKTGANTELGRMGRSLQGLKSPDSPLAAEIRGWVRRFTLWALSLSVGLALLQGWLKQDWLGALLAGITLAMALLPQELLIILTVFTVMTAWRLARQGVLVRRPATAEALGSISVLCMDKTGTLTQNHMAVAAWASLEPHGLVLGEGPAQSHAALNLARIAELACEPQLFDPMDHAIADWVHSGRTASHHTTTLALVHEYGLSQDLMAMTHAWRPPSGGPTQVAMKGAPEAVMALCHLAPAPRRMLIDMTQTMTAKGWRVLAVAAADHTAVDWPDTPRGFEWQLLGLVALADPLRLDAQPMVQACASAGLRVLMITGDHAGTALSIAHQLGLGRDARVSTGPQIAALPESAWRSLVQQTVVFARVLPTQKLALIQQLQAAGEVVAMTGDGVNDAAALKAAHVGMAMGGRGTDVAREAAALVLMDDQLGGIVLAIQEGRRLEDNLRMAMAFAIAVHVPIAGLALTPLLLGWPALLAPVHIAFLEMVISPVCAIVLVAEPLGAAAMLRPPRAASEPLLSGRGLRLSLLQGLLVWAAVGAVYGLSWHDSGSVPMARSAGFTTLLMGSWALILQHHAIQPRVWRGQGPFALVSLLTLVAWATMMGVPPLRDHLGFASLNTATVSLVAAGALSIWAGLWAINRWVSLGYRGFSMRPKRR